MRRACESAPVKLCATTLIALALVVAGCGDDADGGKPAGGTEEPTTRTVQGALGPVEVPSRPKRVVTLLQDADLLLSVGVKPVAIYSPGGIAKHAAERAKGIETLGEAELDVEKLASIRPDLIIGFDTQKEEPNYDELTGIGPFFALEVADQDWQKWGADVAEAVNRTDEWKKRLAEYERLIADTRPKTEGKSVSVVELMGDGKVWWYGPRTPNGRMMEELGMKVQDIPKGTGLFGRNEMGETTEERVDELTGDTLFVMTRSVGDARARQIVGSRVWEGVPAVASDRVRFIDGQTWVDLNPMTIRGVLQEMVSGVQ